MSTFDEFYQSLPEDSNKRGEYFEKVFVPWFLKTDPDLLGIAICLFNQSPTKIEGPIRRPFSIQSFDKELRQVCDWSDLSGISSHSFLGAQPTEVYREGDSFR